MKVEVITHCWSGPGGQYAKLLAYQIASLLRHPPKCHVTLTVASDDDDEPVEAIYQSFWECPRDDARENERRVVPGPVNGDLIHIAPTVTLRTESWYPLCVFQRPVIRNERALNTKADYVWFADADYLFGDGCLDALVQITGRLGNLFFPRTTMISRDHATGDRYIAAPTPLPIDPADFVPKVEKRAIGGIQIVPGVIARTYGYLPNTKWQTPAPEGTNTIIGFRADARYRQALGNRGKPIDLPNLFRLRHSRDGTGKIVPGAAATSPT